MSSMSLLLLTLSAVSASVGQLLFKVGAKGHTQFSEFLNPYIVLGAVLYGAATAVWIFVLSREPLVKVYAFTTLTFALVYIGGVFFLKETLTTTAIFGVLLVLTGLYCIVNGGPTQ
jgi:drug/metabolite transporter (DMT)-like permease